MDWLIKDILTIEQKQGQESDENALRVLRFRKNQALKNYVLRLKEPIRIVFNTLNNSRYDSYFEAEDRLKSTGHILAPLDKAISVCKSGVELKRSPIYKELGKLMETTSLLLERFREKIIASQGSWRRIKTREKALKKFRAIVRFLTKRLDRMSELVPMPPGGLI